MRRLTKLSFVAVGLIGLALGSISPATADESTIYEGQTVSREFTLHEDTPNGRVTTNVTVTESVRADTTPQPAARRCWINEFVITTRSLGAMQHKWQHEVYWCFDNNRAALVRYNKGLNLATGTAWHWIGNETDFDRILNQGGVYFDVRKKGHYCLSYPPFNCVQNNYPMHRAKYLKGAVTLLEWRPR